MLGSSSIWIGGLDLAFPGLKTHFKGARFEEQALSEATRFSPGETRTFRALRDGNPFWAAAADGSRVLTDQRLSLYAAWFENRFHETPGLRNHRLFGEGLALSGLGTASPEEVLALPILREKIDQTLGRAFSRVHQDFMGPAQVQERRVRYAAALGELVQGLKTIKALADAAAEIAHSQEQKGKGNFFLKQLTTIDREIAANPVKDIAGFLLPRGNPASESFTQYGASSLKQYQALSEAAEAQINQIVRGNSLLAG
jgi:hypothetical protein